MKSEEQVIAELQEALNKIANQDDEQVNFKDAGVRCRDIAKQALEANPVAVG